MVRGSAGACCLLPTSLSAALTLPPCPKQEPQIYPAKKKAVDDYGGRGGKREGGLRRAGRGVRRQRHTSLLISLPITSHSPAAVIILACVLGGLLVIPLLIWLGRRLWLARQHRRSRAAAAVGAGASTGARRPLMEPGKIAFSNPAYAPTAAVGVPAPGSPRPNV